MQLDGIKKKFMHCFDAIPQKDIRAKIGPRDFIISIIFCFVQDHGKRSLESIRKSVMTGLNIKIARSTFWERIATKRLISLLLELAYKSIAGVANIGYVTNPCLIWFGYLKISIQ